VIEGLMRFRVGPLGRRRATHARPADTPHGLKPDGFSVHPRRQPHESPKALPAPVNGSRGMVVSMPARARLVPQSGHACQRTDQPWWTTTPPPQQVWLVNAGSSTTTVRPALAALQPGRKGW
jgi:hypothetical protein